MRRASLYSQETIDQLPWEEFEEGLVAKGILLPLIKEGSEKYLANVKTKVFVVTCGNQLLPLTVNETEYQNSYIASNYYLVELFKESTPTPLKHVVKPLAWTLSGILKGARINKFVMLNNWLFAVSTLPQISEDQLDEILELLKKNFPGHYFMWRSLETFNGRDLISHLRTLDFRLLKTRSVFFYDPTKQSEQSSKVQYHHRRDLKLIEKEGYEVVRNGDLKKEDFPRLLELYRKVYIDKHTSFSPGFTSEFLQNAHANHLLNFIALKKNGKIDGIIGYFTRGKTMICPFFGYETDLPPSSGLYRMLSVLLYKESEQKNLALNDSSGGDDTKKWRGLKLFDEYIAIYDRHLPLRRRLFWNTVDLVMNKLFKRSAN